MRIDNNLNSGEKTATICCPPNLLDRCRSFLDDEFFKAFVDESRRNILLMVMEHGELSVNDISSRVNINQSNVSRHLALLHRAGIASKRRRGRETYYRINYEHIGERLSNLLGVVNHCCPPEQPTRKTS